LEKDYKVSLIDSRHGSVNIHEIWQYRDLLWLLVRRDFVAFYKQTIFGPVWFFIQPVFTTLVFIFLFSRVAGISTDGIPAPLFYLSGIILWNYFAECLLKTSTVFKDNAHIFGKVYFPRLIMPLSIVFSNLIRFFVQLILLIILIGYFFFQKGYDVKMSVYLLILPIIIFLMAILGLGLGMIVSALTTKYRDLAFLLAFGVQLLMYATTVAYPLSAAPAQFKTFIALNPMSVLIESFRFCLFQSGNFSWLSFSAQALFVGIVFVFGAVIFTRQERSFMDTV
jgi:lipopolysaccharide transport system permease protein